MRKKSRRLKKPEELVITRFFAKDSENDSLKPTSTYHEPESIPWFKPENDEAVDSQIDSYIDVRFAETGDREMIDFLKNNNKFREIVTGIRSDYITTEKIRRKKAA